MLRLTWPVKAGKTYRVMCAEMLDAGNWILVNGPTIAPTNGHLSWTASDLNAATGRSYRIEIQVP